MNLGGHNSACNNIRASNSQTGGFYSNERGSYSNQIPGPQCPEGCEGHRDASVTSGKRLPVQELEEWEVSRAQGTKAQKALGCLPSCLCLGPHGSPFSSLALVLWLPPDCSPHPSVLLPWASCRPPLLLPECWGQEWSGRVKWFMIISALSLVL